MHDTDSGEYEGEYVKPVAEIRQQHVFDCVKALFAQVEVSQEVTTMRRVHQALACATVANRIRNYKSDVYEKFEHVKGFHGVQVMFASAGEDIRARIELPPADFDKWKSQFVEKNERANRVDFTQIHADVDRIAEDNWQSVALALTDAYWQAVPNFQKLRQTALLSSAYQAFVPNRQTEPASSAYAPAQNTNPRRR
ncbi:hypothetical protein ACFWD7_57075 [Streptomyces mirabilis]|uniref:hypothetical protein n=1 Tax=Streptomyces mirabilis TaxID=68239 RepID=UPI00368E4853